jgi:hypothetical protein
MNGKRRERPIGMRPSLLVVADDWAPRSLFSRESAQLIATVQSWRKDPSPSMQTPIHTTRVPLSEVGHVIAFRSRHIPTFMAYTFQPLRFRSDPTQTHVFLIPIGTDLKQARQS